MTKYEKMKETNENSENIISNFDNILPEDKKNVEDIINLISEEKSDFVLKKLFYLLFREIGFNNKVSSSFLNISMTTGNNWIKQWQMGGYDNLLRKPGQGRKPKLTDEQLEILKKKLSQRDDWFTWEISNFIYNEFGVKYHISSVIRILREKLNAKFGKPYPHEYRRNKHYKSSFHLKLRQKLRKYDLKYDNKTGNITDRSTGKPFLIFSFDEAAFQFTSNYVKVWSLFKPQIETDSTIFSCKMAGFHSLTPEGNDHITSMKNATKETIADCLKQLREKNPDGTIMLLIDNFSSHKSLFVKEEAKKLNIDLCFLPAYSP